MLSSLQVPKWLQRVKITEAIYCLRELKFNQNSLLFCAAVTAANTDLSNSDALQISAVADPDGTAQLC
jgi:hypothetical protein